MAKPRCIEPNKIHFLTRRVALRRFRLRPCKKTNHILRYALGLVAEKTGVVLHAVCVLSNHIHLLVRDVRGVLPEFLRELYRTLAKAMNTLQGERENFWASEPAHSQRVADDEAFLDRFAYLVANPVAAGLVKAPDRWPGVLLYRPGVFRVRRPDVYFAKGGDCPEEVELRIEQPETAWPLREWAERLKGAIASRVYAARAKMLREGRRFLGVEGVLATSIHARAESAEPLRAIIPTIAATERETLRWHLKVYQAFLVAYRIALTAWRGGDRTVVFPAGTWWMGRHHSASVAPS